MPGDNTAHKAEFPGTQMVRADETWSKSLITPVFAGELIVSIDK